MSIEFAKLSHEALWSKYFFSVPVRGHPTVYLYVGRDSYAVAMPMDLQMRTYQTLIVTELDKPHISAEQAAVALLVLIGQAR